MKRVLKLAAMVGLNILAITAVAATPKMPTFFARRDYPGLDSYFVQVADTNGDGIPDLIANEFGYIEVLFGNGNGTFRPGPNSLTSDTATSFFVAANLTGSGPIDLVLASGSGVVVCMGNGTEPFNPACSIRLVTTSRIWRLATSMATASWT
jgi:FG-GAP-like repeat